jgi:lysophospholipase L1-like esterase
MLLMKSFLTLSILAIVAVSHSHAELLPVFHPNDVMLFQGDSITDGGRARTGNDYNHTMGQDFAYIIAAQIGALYPERNLTFINRGISGNTVVDLSGRWQSDTLNLKPNVLSILVGINDTLTGVHKGETVEQYEKLYDKLITDTQAALPNVRIVLCQPFLLPVGKHKDVYGAELAEVKKRQDVLAKLADKYHLPEVLFQKAFDNACQKTPADHWSWDGVHPTYAGHGLMASEWLKTVEAFWPNG